MLRIVQLISTGALSLLILLLSGYALSTTPKVPTFMVAALGTVLLMVVFVARMTGGRAVSLRIVAPWLALVIPAMASGMIDQTRNGFTAAGYFICIVTMASLIVLLVDFDSFITTFVRLMRILTIVAIGVHILFITLGVELPLEQVTNTNEVTYLNGYAFFLVITQWGELIPRTMSVFWEPGLYASFLVFALICVLHLKGRGRRKVADLVLFTAGVLLTRSTAGYLIVFILFTFTLISRSKRFARPLVFAAIMCFLALGRFWDNAVAELGSIDPSTFGKLDSEGLVAGTRGQSPGLNLQIFAESPLSGMGLGGASATYERSMTATDIAAQTSTSTYFLAAFGIAGAVYTILWIFAILQLSRITIYGRLGILICVLLIVNKEPHTSILTSYIFLFYFLREGGQQWPRAQRVPTRSASYASV